MAIHLSPPPGSALYYAPVSTLEQSKLFSTFKDLKAPFSIKGHGENS
jgi:hypothetical protein